MRRIRAPQLMKAMLFGGIGTFLGIAINAALDYARKDWGNPVGIAAVAALACVSGIIPLFQGEKNPPAPPAPPPGSGYPPASGYPPGSGYQGTVYPSQPYPGGVYPSQPGRPQARRSGRVPLITAAIVLLVACGGGAAGVTFGVQYLGGYLTGHENGTDILAASASAEEGPLAVEIRRVEVTRHFTRVEVAGRNSGSDSLTLPVFKNTLLTAAGGRSLEGDPSRSDWPETIPPGGQVTGVIVFSGKLPAGVTSASFSFTTIFGSLRGPRSITVRDIALRADR
jgi:hypothetical protein